MKLMSVLQTKFIVVRPSLLSKKFPRFFESKIYATLSRIAHSKMMEYFIDGVLM